MTFEESSAAETEQQLAEAHKQFEAIDYQIDAALAVVKAFLPTPEWYRMEGREVRRPLVVAPTASGKSVIIAHTCKMLLDRGAPRPIVVMAYVDTIVRANADAYRGMTGNGNISVIAGGRGKITGHEDVVFVTAQTYARRVKQLPSSRVLLIDEAHRGTEKETHQLRRAIAEHEALAAEAPTDVPVRVGGYTATPYVLNGRSIYGHGKDMLFDFVAFEIGRRVLLERGRIAPVAFRAGATSINLTGVRKIGGEYDLDEVAELFRKQGATEAVIDECLALYPDRRHWMIFACGKTHAEAIHAYLAERGRKGAIITGDTPKRTADAAIKAFRAGGLGYLVSVEKLNVGFDAPICDMLLWLRPTASRVLWVQGNGRGGRIYPGKVNCISHDAVGNTLRHGVIDADWCESAEHIAAPARVKVCPQCSEMVNSHRRICSGCGHDMGYNGMELPDGAVPDQIKLAASAWGKEMHSGNPYGDARRHVARLCAEMAGVRNAHPRSLLTPAQVRSLTGIRADALISLGLPTRDRGKHGPLVNAADLLGMLAEYPDLARIGEELSAHMSIAVLIARSVTII